MIDEAKDETAEQPRLQTPQRPAELWGLWANNGERGYWMVASDEIGEPILCYLCERNAEHGAKAHRELYDGLECIPVRIDTLPRAEAPLILHAKTADGNPLDAQQVESLRVHVAAAGQDEPTDIAEALKDIRLFLGFGLREFAERCEIVPSDLAGFEHGRAEFQHFTDEQRRRIICELGARAKQRRKRADASSQGV